MPPRNQHSVVVLHLANFAWYKAIQVEEFQVILNFVHLRDWPVMKCILSPGNFCEHFLFSSKIKTTYPGVHPPISSFALRPELGLWRSE